MAKKLYPETDIQAIADAIRAKNGSSDTYTVGQMASAIEDIPSGSETPVSVDQLVNTRSTSQDSKSAMFHADNMYGTDLTETLWTYTATAACSVIFDSECKAKTNTGSNDGYLAIEVNQVNKHKQYLTSETLTNLSAPEIKLNRGDVLTLIAGFDNEHTNCWFDVYAAVSIVSSGAITKLIKTIYIKDKPNDPGDYIRYSLDGETWTDCYYSGYATAKALPGTDLILRYASPYFQFYFDPTSASDDYIAVYNGKVYAHDDTPGQPVDGPMIFAIDWHNVPGMTTEQIDIYEIEVAPMENYHDILNALIDKSINCGIDSNVNIVGDYAFYNCSNLAYANFPNANVIGTGAFYKCKSLNNINFPNVVSILENAFCGCNNLITANFDNVNMIHSLAFQNCRGLKSFYSTELTYLGSTVFNYCGRLENFYAPNVTNIGRYCFAGCSSLNSIDFPQLLNMSDGYTFMNCSGLKTANIPNVPAIPDYVFYGCNNLTYINAMNAKTISSSGLYSCSNLTSVDFPYVKNLKISCFANCTNLVTANLPNVTSMEMLVFNNCRNLSHIDLPSINYINTNSFANCVNLLTANFNNVTFIDRNAFSNCISMYSIDLPKVSNVYIDAFNNCSNLVSINLPNAINIYVYAFNRCSNLNTIYLGRNDIVCSVSPSALANTPFGKGLGGTFYVPNSIIASYNTDASADWNIILRWPNVQVLPMD